MLASGPPSEVEECRRIGLEKVETAGRRKLRLRTVEAARPLAERPGRSSPPFLHRFTTNPPRIVRTPLLVPVQASGASDGGESLRRSGRRARGMGSASEAGR